MCSRNGCAIRTSGVHFFARTPEPERELTLHPLVLAMARAIEANARLSRQHGISSRSHASSARAAATTAIR